LNSLYFKIHRLQSKADYSLDAQGIDSPEATLCQGSESYIVAPLSGAGTRREAGAGECCIIQDGRHARIRAAAMTLCRDNRPQTVRINIQPQREGAQAW
jgi:hypothetical protein